MPLDRAEVDTEHAVNGIETMTARLKKSTLLFFSFTAAVLMAIGPHPHAQEEDEDAKTDLQPGLVDTDMPRRHVRVWQVADLEANEANRIYELVRGALAKGYASAGLDHLEDYQTFKRYNSSPYLSSAHGKHYLNNYANETARKYGEYEDAGRLPVGSVLYKDSFSVTESHQNFSVTDTRQIILGPLFIMRKMEPGFNHLTGDWQYIQIQPDGALLGITGGEGADRVEYCIGCHLSREEYDHLFFIPADHRL